MVSYRAALMLAVRRRVSTETERAETEAMSERQRVSGQKRYLSSVIATCPECGTGARVSSSEIRFDDTGCRLLSAGPPHSCAHLNAVISAAQELLRDL
jgi:RNase P subunit RPR2